ncbi:MAG TPA: hypothetical protein VIL36_04915 [Acidimicrobiales bacterium]
MASSLIVGPTGLGTAAARVRKGRGFWPPRFAIPFPRRVNPEVERLRADGLAWARARGLVDTDEAVARLDAARFDRLTAYAYPEARGAGADLAAHWMYWFFLFDDWFDGPLGRDPAAARTVVERLTAHVHGGPAAVDGVPTDPPLVRAFVELFDRSAAGMAPASRHRFALDTAQYLFTNYMEAFHRVRGGLDDLGTVTHVRRYSIGVLPSLDFGEPANGFSLAAELVGGEPLHRLRTITADVIAAVNEAFSLGKDLALGETTSAAVTMMRLRRWTPEETIGFLERTVAELLDEHRRLEVEAREQAQRFGLPEEAGNVARYLQMLRDWMVANLRWSEETPRYHDASPHPGAPASPPGGADWTLPPAPRWRRVVAPARGT